MSEARSASSAPEVASELTAFQRNILLILAEEARYGLAVKRDLESYYGTEVNHGRLYPNLDELVELGLVEKSELDKRTNEYALTEEGESVLLSQFRWEFSKFVTGDDRAAAVEDLLADVRN